MNLGVISDIILSQYSKYNKNDILKEYDRLHFK